MTVQGPAPTIAVTLPRATLFVEDVVDLLYDIVHAQEHGGLRPWWFWLMRLHPLWELTTNGTVRVVPTKIHDTAEVKPMTAAGKTQTVMLRHDIGTHGALVRDTCHGTLVVEREEFHTNRPNTAYQTKA